MMTKNADKKREQMMMFCMDDMVPSDHLLRLIDKAIDWTFIYDLDQKYAPDDKRDRGKCRIPLVFRFGHAGFRAAFFYVWKELYPPFSGDRPVRADICPDSRGLHEIRLCGYGIYFS